MSRTKVKKQTFHGVKRVKQRCGITNDRSLKNFVKAASKHGYSPQHLNEGRLKNYLINKSQRRNKRIKIYKGYVFIFNNTSDGLITAYEIPERFMEEFNTFIAEKKTYLN